MDELDKNRLMIMSGTIIIWLGLPYWLLNLSNSWSVIMLIFWARLGFAELAKVFGALHKPMPTKKQLRIALFLPFWPAIIASIQRD